MGDPTAWLQLESDPGVFTELCERVGVRGVEFAEIYGLDPETFTDFALNNKIHGFVFLFKHDGISGSRSHTDTSPPGLFFAKQIIADACASMAILSILMNRNENVHIGPALTSYRDMVIECDPEIRGFAVSNLEALRLAHNSFACTPAFEARKATSKKNAKDQFHFISYVPFGGHCWELDGLRQGPVDCGAVKEIEGCPEVIPEEDKWIELARREVASRIEQIMSRGNELRFTLLAMVDAKDSPLRLKREATQWIVNQAEGVLGGEQISSIPESFTASQKDIVNQWINDDAYQGWTVSEDSAALILDQAMSAVEELNTKLIADDKKRSIWERENARRRHDFTPFTLKVLDLLQKHGKLQDIYNNVSK